MDAAAEIRRSYDQLPYPLVRHAPAMKRKWELAPMRWIQAVAHPFKRVPDRILVAGCGTGVEAFMLRTSFPNAKITGIDFSPRSIQVARRLQKSLPARHRVDFQVGDLTDPRLPRAIGANYDFITCHGVLSYIPNPGAALRNLARCLAKDGALYLGMNGCAHFHRAFRPVLSAFGHDLNHFKDGPALRRLLRLCDLIVDHPPGLVATKDPTFLAGDLFGPLNRALSLRGWNALARVAGLHCWGSLGALDALRPVLEDSAFFLPRSRAQLAELLDGLSPAGFHRLVYKKSSPAVPPWQDGTALLDWRPRRTDLYFPKFPHPTAKPAHGMVALEVRSPALNTLVEMRLPGWEVQLLRRSHGQQSIRRILSSCPSIPPRRTLARHLYRLYQLTVLNLEPPERK